MSRDLTVCVVSLLQEAENISYLDALAATGIRGLRVANESGAEVVLNDWNKEAYELCVRNTQLCGRKVEVLN
ncbi:hypothetical protein DRN72_00350 [Methanosarcinales archaeon]|nr:MAG: hypothetical protein DRN72_00350 [Methanosarcinales archaeon]